MNIQKIFSQALLFSAVVASAQFVSAMEAPPAPSQALQFNPGTQNSFAYSMMEMSTATIKERELILEQRTNPLESTNADLNLFVDTNALLNRPFSSEFMQFIEEKHAGGKDQPDYAVFGKRAGRALIDACNRMFESVKDNSGLLAAYLKTPLKQGMELVLFVRLANHACNAPTNSNADLDWILYKQIMAGKAEVLQQFSLAGALARSKNDPKWNNLITAVYEFALEEAKVLQDTESFSQAQEKLNIMRQNYASKLLKQAFMRA